jgi:hypothetical protein
MSRSQKRQTATIVAAKPFSVLSAESRESTEPPDAAFDLRIARKFDEWVNICLFFMVRLRFWVAVQ